MWRSKREAIRKDGSPNRLDPEFGHSPPNPPMPVSEAKPPDHVYPMIGLKLATVIKKSRMGGNCHPRF